MVSAIREVRKKNAHVEDAIVEGCSGRVRRPVEPAPCTRALRRAGSGFARRGFRSDEIFERNRLIPEV